jgi:hypothetical protein
MKIGQIALRGDQIKYHGTQKTKQGYQMAKNINVFLFDWYKAWGISAKQDWSFFGHIQGLAGEFTHF